MGAPILDAAAQGSVLLIDSSQAAFGGIALLLVFRPTYSQT